MKKSVKVLATLAGLLIAWQAQATLITGEIAFGGAVTPDNPNLAAATALDFGGALVIGGVGDFAQVPFGTPAAFTDFQFDPLVPKPVDPLWSVSFAGGSFDFRLDDIVVNSESSSSLSLTGVGVFRGQGYDETLGTWNFQVNGGQAIVSFLAYGGPNQSSGGGIAVPDSGTTAMLLGLALTSLGFFTRRFRS